MIRFSVTESQMVPLVLPGAILAIGIPAAIAPRFAGELSTLASNLGTHLSGEAAAGWVVLLTAVLTGAFLLLYGAALLLGTVSTILAGYLEHYLLDRFYEPWRLGVSRDEYQKQWHRYLDHLEEQQNPYISRGVDLFYFASRSAVNLVILLPILVVVGGIPWWPYPVIVLVAAALVIIVALDIHASLAAMRKRRFSSPDSEVTSADEMIQRLIAKWCSREALDPLRKILPVWPPTMNSESAAALANALDNASQLPGSAVFDSEKQTLSRAIAIYKERAENLAPSKEKPAAG
jgi:hypothetical protein